MRKRFLIYTLPVPLIAATTAAVVLSPSAHADEANQALEETIDSILEDPRLVGSHASVVVADPETGEVIYDRNGEDRQLPASNVKLLTSAAAIDILGEDYRFDTDVHVDGKVRGSAAIGDLYLRGTGDPTMLQEDYVDLAQQVAATGIKTVTGDLVADDTRFDDTRLGRSWPWDNEQFYYQAQISPLTLAPDTDYDAGTVFVSVTPSDSPDEAPTVTLQPETDYVTIDNTATTVASGGANNLQITRKHATNTIAISGTIPVDANNRNSWTTVWEPTGYATAVFADALKDAGVRVIGDVRLGQEVPEDALTVATHQSMTLEDLMIPFMKLSNNGHSEALVKTIGHEVSGAGTWNAGLAAIADFLADQGVDTSVLSQADGSGLSRQNLVAANEFIDLLSATKDAHWYETWYDSLPIACEGERLVGGTLRSRMCGTPAESNARAKTGSLNGVSGLSGYVTDADGRDLVFSILLNKYVMPGGVKDIEDQIVIALASFSAEEASAPMPQYSPPASEIDGDLECSWVKPAVC
ncbi:D-alanyl-D-alanine carboxypeptidase/D-alanyl-D-alanine endopeptidase [Natronoglycomyces albus]|uniref:D-alanyl-D-alanine carboxypeptidase/D-alanyl-D-alanine-endopeptidase n=1 Tax=Natronoglycomyces albus TaxID=2811108 RepID=A0A895XH18_9ACTN|nr:D-alanyl-D-alanine carboxypeptidase/D-alanyl-D-alanine-endopeptidase [Natronoglycomyces albus]QSB04207.1 D-alanyl-D-alanine carboxypeptidase/D-alanyl-D-alanine-endopeptidase [Natronoglycomyces albus]